MTISAVIVTWNRKNDLIRCIEAVLNQSHAVQHVIVVNNASTDGTAELVSEKYSGNSKIILITLPENTGGAGGFYTGLKYAHENLQTDRYWLMDDDGYPEEHCLEQLLSASTYDYVMPCSLDITNPDKLSWFTHKKNGKQTDQYTELCKSWGSVMDWVTPFNGVLLTEECVSKAGYINKDFFIWGDDYEHYYRCLASGFHPVTWLPAKFFHPSQTKSSCKMLFGLLHISHTDSNLRFYCMIRNWTWIYLHYGQKWKIPVKYVMYLWFFMFTRRFDFAGWRLYRTAVHAGFTGDFTGHKQYLR